MLSGVFRRLSSVTLHGGPVEFRPVRATPCFELLIRFTAQRICNAVHSAILVVARCLSVCRPTQPFIPSGSIDE